MLQSPIGKKTGKRKLLFPAGIVLLISVIAALFTFFHPLLPQQPPPGIVDTPATTPGTIDAFDNSLRGAIYDRRYRELAVSYPLYSVRIQPVDIRNPDKTAALLCKHLGGEPDLLRSRIRESRRPFTLAEGLAFDQVAPLMERKINGVVCTKTAHRFYPNHEIGAHVLGFTEENLGLAGVESRFDQILQPGVYQTDILPEISFGGRKSAGIQGTDLVLTIDLDIEKMLTEQLGKLVNAGKSGKAQALLMDIANGDILALVSMPSFNPNYFWRADDTRRSNRVTRQEIDWNVYRDILVRAAAIAGSGELGDRLPPATVAAPDYNVSGEDIAGFAAEIGLYNPIDCDLAGGTESDYFDGADAATGPTSALNLLTAIAALQNGGREIRPHLLAAVHDRATDSLFPYRQQRGDGVNQGLYRTLSPALGVRMRLELFQRRTSKGTGALLYTNSISRVSNRGLSRYIMQDLLISLFPAAAPRYALLISRSHEMLEPRAKTRKPSSIAWNRFCKTVLTALSTYTGESTAEVAEFPAHPDTTNYNRFLIGRSMSVPPEPQPSPYAEYVMPKVTGLSLRKGLQLLTGRNLFIRVRGSGRIVGQQPEAGTRLQDVRECILSLEPPNRERRQT